MAKTVPEPNTEQAIAIVYPDGGEMIGTIKQVTNELAMVIWPGNPIEDWVERSTLTWNDTNKRWEMPEEG